MTRLPYFSPPPSASASLRNLTHLRIVGIRVDFELLGNLPELEELILDVAHYAHDVKVGYNEEDVRAAVKSLTSRDYGDDTSSMRRFTMSMVELGFETLSLIGRSFPKLEKLDLIGGGRDDYLPLTSVYPTDITNNVVRRAHSPHS